MKLLPENDDNTCLQELSLMSRTYFAAIHYCVHLNVNFDHLMTRIFYELSLLELETLHGLCKLEKTQIQQPLALGVLKITYAGYLLSCNRSNFIDNK